MGRCSTSVAGTGSGPVTWPSAACRSWASSPRSTGSQARSRAFGPRRPAPTLARLLDDADLEVVDRYQHSLVSFAAWTLPRVGRRAWLWLGSLEDRLPASWTTRWGAHMEFVLRRR